MIEFENNIDDDNRRFIESNLKMIELYERNDKFFGEDHSEDIEKLKQQIEDVKSGKLKIVYSKEYDK